MKVAVIGSRTGRVRNLGNYLPDGVDEIVSGGAKGIDADAKAYALATGLKITEFLPEYKRYGRSAPIKRNQTIVEYADIVVAFWDGRSRGTKYVLDICKKTGKPVTVHLFNTLGK